MIRLFCSKDFPIVLKQYCSTFSDDVWKESWGIEKAEQYLSELISNEKFYGFVYEQNHNIIGVCLGHTYTWFNGNIYNIDELFVIEQFRQQGIGTQLIDYLKIFCLDRNISIITLTTKKNSMSEKFYKKNKFINNPYECNMLHEIIK